MTTGASGRRGRVEADASRRASAPRRRCCRLDFCQAACTRVCTPDAARRAGAAVRAGPPRAGEASSWLIKHAGASLRARACARVRARERACVCVRVKLASSSACVHAPVPAADAGSRGRDDGGPAGPAALNKRDSEHGAGVRRSPQRWGRGLDPVRADGPSPLPAREPVRHDGPLVILNAAAALWTGGPPEAKAGLPGPRAALLGLSEVARLCSILGHF